MRMIVLLLAAGMAGGCTAESEPAQREKTQGQEQVGNRSAEKQENPRDKKLTVENYLKINEGMQHGMQHDEVRLLLGNPHKSNVTEKEKEVRAFPGLESPAYDAWKLGEGTQPFPNWDRFVFVHYKWDGSKWRVTKKSQEGLE